MHFKVFQVAFPLPVYPYYEYFPAKFSPQSYYVNAHEYIVFEDPSPVPVRAQAHSESVHEY